MRVLNDLAVVIMRAHVTENVVEQRECVRDIDTKKSIRELQRAATLEKSCFQEDDGLNSPRPLPTLWD